MTKTSRVGLYGVAVLIVGVIWAKLVAACPDLAVNGPTIIIVGLKAMVAAAARTPRENVGLKGATLGAFDAGLMASWSQLATDCPGIATNWHMILFSIVTTVGGMMVNTSTRTDAPLIDKSVVNAPVELAKE